MTGTVSYFVDCASYQGAPDWARISASCVGGAEKATEGTSYFNPYWAGSKAALRAITPHGFIPMAYCFLDAIESGADQADYFAQVAGDLTGFGIAVDCERAPNGNPARQQAVDAVARLRQLYPHHPVGGYAPRWYAGGWDLTFFDWLWASQYVSGSGDPAALYDQVPASWWAPYGGRSPLMLQFTSAAQIAGIGVPADCSAFHGDRAQLAAQVLPAAPKPPPPPPPAQAVPSADLIILRAGEAPVFIPVWPDEAAYGEPADYRNCSLVLAGATGAAVRVVLHGTAGEARGTVLQAGKPWVVVPPGGWKSVAVVELQRTDTKTGISASAAFRAW